MLELFAPPEKKPKDDKKMNHNKMDFVLCFFTVLPKPFMRLYKKEITSKITKVSESGIKYSLKEGVFMVRKYNSTASTKYH